MKTLLAASLLALGAASTHAALVTYEATLGPEAAGATGSGSVTLVYDSTARTLGIDAVWAGLSGTTTVAHVHCCVMVAGAGTAGVAVTPPTLPGFPTGLSSGSYATAVPIDLSAVTSYPAAFLGLGGGTVAGAEALLLAGLDAGTAYFNIHSTAFPGGEIRGFPARADDPNGMPEPGTLALAVLAASAVVASGRRRRGRAGA